MRLLGIWCREGPISRRSHDPGRPRPPGRATRVSCVRAQIRRPISAPLPADLPTCPASAPRTAISGISAAVAQPCLWVHNARDRSGPARRKAETAKRLARSCPPNQLARPLHRASRLARPDSVRVWSRSCDVRRVSSASDYDTRLSALRGPERHLPTYARLSGSRTTSRTTQASALAWALWFSLR